MCNESYVGTTVSTLLGDVLLIIVNELVMKTSSTMKMFILLSIHYCLCLFVLVLYCMCARAVL